MEAKPSRHAETMEAWQNHRGIETHRGIGKNPGMSVVLIFSMRFEGHHE